MQVLPPVIVFEIWDNDQFSPDDFLGESFIFVYQYALLYLKVQDYFLKRNLFLKYRTCTNLI